MRSIIVFLIVFIVLAACSDNSNNNNSALPNIRKQGVSKEQKIIKLVGPWYQQGGREKLIKDFVRYYNFTHQETEVVIEFTEEMDNDYLSTLEVTLKEQITKPQSDWDIILINNSYHFTMDGDTDWAKKYLVDFSQYPEFRQNTIPGLINDSTKRIWHGIIPGPFVEGFSYSLWCNNNVAKKVGVKVNQVGMTFDDFVHYIKAVYEYNQNNPNDYIIPIFEGGGWKTLSKFFEQLYASILNDEVEYFNDYASERKLNAWYLTLKQFERLTPYEPFRPKWRSGQWTESIPAILNDKCFFYSNGTWMYSNYENEDKTGELVKNLMPTEYPVVNPVSTYPAGYQILWAVPKNAANKEEAVEFLLTMNSPVFAEDWVRQAKCPTGIKGSLTSVSAGLDQFENYVYGIQKKYGNSTFLAIGAQTIFGSANQNINLYAHEVLEGSITPEEAMTRIRQALEDRNVEIIQNLF